MREGQALPAVIRVKGVSHEYGSTCALKEVTLEIPAGCIVGLIGPDGVGKSTLMGLIAGARKIQAGLVEVLEGDMGNRQHRNRVGPRIAYMPQGLGKNLYSDLSVAENLDFFGRLFGQGAKERAVRRTQLTKATGLFEFLDRPAGKLSGGMKQKLGLCCALIHDPDLLILDEPTTGVDPLSRRQFWALIASIRAERPGMSVLVSTAYMDEAEQFDWLVAMNGGEVLATGTPEAIKRQAGAVDLDRSFISLLPESERRDWSEVEVPPRTQTEGGPAISAKNLTRRFGNFTAVDRVSFTIEPGEIFGFLGSNGCGKTTTMKVLTGLLPPSEGEVRLWGKVVDATNLDTRRRIGFMSQAFSLYSEMSVRQNLLLHARLFHLSSERTQARIEALVTRFKLANYMSHLAGDLPLGLRQRLSLAVALIHEPEILILDEPTSGVDPLARDEFWRLLIALSREEGVTIFISTHFMTEAVRCDRISLMHAGKVLAQDTPVALMAAKGAETLEDAFIEYMEDAINEADATVEVTPDTTHDTTPDTERLDQSDAEPHFLSKTPSLHFSSRRLFAYSIRETLEVLRDPVRLAFAFLGSILLLLIFTYGVTTDVNNIKFAALDLDQSPASRAYLKGFEGSQYFSEQAPLSSQKEAEKRLVSQDIEVAIEIPSGFGRDLKRGETPSISARIDGANTFRAGTVEGYVNGAHADYLASTASRGAPALMQFEPRFKYNPTMESIYAMAPAMPAILLILFPAILMAVSVAREKEIGTITNFYVTPTTRIEFVLGKQLPYIAIGVTNFTLLTLFVVFVMGVSIKGSAIALVLGGVLYVTVTTALGFLFSSMVKSQVAAVFVTAVLTMMPTMQFSGLMQPVSTLETTGQLIGSFWPTTYFMHLSVGSYTKGLGLADLSVDLWMLLAFVPVLIGASAMLLRKQEK